MSLFVMNARRRKVVLSLAAVLIAGLGIGIPVTAQTVVIKDGLKRSASHSPRRMLMMAMVS